MVDIAAFIGTIRPGQAIFKTWSKSDLDKGFISGLGISIMALSVNQMITR
jgi:ABC-type proline/glycine betaine transport system permease subunit